MTDWVEPREGPPERLEPERFLYPMKILQKQHVLRAYPPGEAEQAIRDSFIYEEMLRRQEAGRRAAIKRFSRRWFEVRWFDLSLRFSNTAAWRFWRRYRRYIRLAGLFLLFDLGVACGWHLARTHPPHAGLPPTTYVDISPEPELPW